MPIVLFLFCCLWLGGANPTLAQAQPGTYGQPIRLSQYRDVATFSDPFERIQVGTGAPTILRADTSLRKPSVHIQQDTAIDIGLRQYANPYRTLGSGIVYRVQIYNGDREKASLAQFDFMELRTGQPVYMEFDQPNFKVRVGNFKTEQEAKTFVKDVQLHFPSAFVVPCQLTPER